MLGTQGRLHGNGLCISIQIYANEHASVSPLMNMLMSNAWHTGRLHGNGLCVSIQIYANERASVRPLMNMLITPHSPWPSLNLHYYYVVFVCERTRGGTRMCDLDMLTPGQESPWDFRVMSSWSRTVFRRRQAQLRAKWSIDRGIRTQSVQVSEVKGHRTSKVHTWQDRTHGPCWTSLGWHDCNGRFRHWTHLTYVAQ